MKAARLHRFDERLEGPDFLALDEVEEPVISAPDDILVRIGGAGVCRTDLHIIQGLWQDAQQVDLPYTLGHENAGWVEEIGAGVRGVEKGDAVVLLPGIGDGTCDACRAGLDNRCTALAWQGIQFDGGFTGLLRTNARNLVRLPEGMEPVQAAPYADAGLTAFHAVRTAGRTLPAGGTAVVIGVGGLGHVAVQVLRALYAVRIIAVDTSRDALNVASHLGADELVQAGEDAVDQVLSLTGGRGAQAVIDFVGEADVPGQAFAMTGSGGQYVVVGYGGTLTVPTMDVMGSERSIVGVVGGTYTELKELLALSSRGTVTLRVTALPLDEVNEAITALRDGRLNGRAVLVP
jgi:NAD+-dependent secondary alcohol dehydrogenase Adh1